MTSCWGLAETRKTWMRHTMSTQSRLNGHKTQKERKENLKSGRQCGRSDAGFTLLLERMTIEEWDAFRAGKIDIEALRTAVLDNNGESTTAGELNQLGDARRGDCDRA